MMKNREIELNLGYGDKKEREKVRDIKVRGGWEKRLNNNERVNRMRISTDKV